jgi:Flp pilus assembly protein protease CpaA
MQAFDPFSPPNLTELGTTLLVGNLTLSAFLMYFVLRGNIPESIPTESYGRVLAGKIVFAILLAMLSTMPATGPGAPFAGLVHTLALLGPGYFIYSMMADVFLAAILRKLEFYGAYKVIIFNLFYIPFVTFAALLLAVREQNKTLKMAREDIAYKEGGVVVGEAVECVRVIRKPIRTRDEADVDPHYDVRLLPGTVETLYKPGIVHGRDFNPHLVIAGASGSGKTTLIYHMLTELSKSYPTVFVDVKGDISRALLKEKVNAHIVHIASVGVNPFTKIRDETVNELVERLMDSISVVEPVGSRQEHLIREAVITYCGRREDGREERPPSYPVIVNYLRGFVKTLPPPEVRWGMGGSGTRDALFSIYSKLEDLSSYFRDDGVSVPQVIARALKTPDGRKRVSDFPIVVFNLEGISEKVRAIVLELILRNIAKYMYHRGPLAYLKELTLVIVVDEAYLVARPLQHNGKIGEDSRSILQEIARAGRSYGVALILATQRLSDVADGILQNCQTRICFNTTSPEDREIIGMYSGVLSEVVPDLEPGHAYIWNPNPRRRKSYRSTADTIAIVEGYIFRMSGRLLQSEEEGAKRLLQKLKEKKKKDKRGRRLQVEAGAELDEVAVDMDKGSSLLDYGKVCYRCMLITTDSNHCPTCGQPPLLKRPEPEQASENRDKAQKQQPLLERTEKTAVVRGEKQEEGEKKQASTTQQKISKYLVPVRVIGADTIRRRAAELYPDKSGDIQALSDEDIINVIECFKEGKIIDVEQYVDKGLVKKVGGGKIKPGSVGKIILDVYDELVARFMRGEGVAYKVCNQ